VIPRRCRDEAARNNRGQLLVLAALVLAVLFVGLAMIVNAAIYTESLAVQKDDSTQDAIQANQHAVETIGDHIAYVNRNHNASHRTLGENFTTNVGEWNQAVAAGKTKRGAYSSLSVNSILNRTEVVHENESHQFANATGAGNWTLAGGVETVSTYRMEVHDDALVETGGSQPFRIRAQNGTSWELAVTKDSGTGEIVLTVTDGDGNVATCRTSGPTAQLDLVAGTVDGADCPGLEVGTGVAQPYTLAYENGTNGRGDYDLTVLTSSRVDDGQYHAETGSPRATYAIDTATVAHTYQTGDVVYTATVVVSPDA
jgi:hypothetical protein